MTNKPSFDGQCSIGTPIHTFRAQSSLRRPNCAEHVLTSTNPKRTAEDGLCKWRFETTLDLPPLRYAAAAGKSFAAQPPRSYHPQEQQRRIGPKIGWKTVFKAKNFGLTIVSTRGRWDIALCHRLLLSVHEQSDFQTLMPKLNTTTTPTCATMSWASTNMISQDYVNGFSFTCVASVAKAGLTGFAQRTDTGCRV